MKWLNNLFKKKKSTVVNVTNEEDDLKLSSNGIDYRFEPQELNTTFVEIQSSDDNIKPYGWVIEVKYSKHYDWSTHWNHKIYSSRNVAIQALIPIRNLYLSVSKDAQFRISAIYVMDQNSYRNYKINILVNNKVDNVNKYELKSWKVIEDVELDVIYFKGKLKSGTTFIQLEDGRIIRSGIHNTPTDFYSYSYKKLLFNELVPKNLVKEVDLKDEKWLHPHLLKELRAKIKQ